MKIKILLLAVSLTYSATSWSEIDVYQTKQNIESYRQHWFEYLRNKILTNYPVKGSLAAEWDRSASREYTTFSGERYNLAQRDKNQSHEYIYRSFVSVVSSGYTDTHDLRAMVPYQQIAGLYRMATIAYDENKKRNRSVDFILKDIFRRGRPYQVLDAKGNYKKNYEKIKGSSFPSGHTWMGFSQAIPLALIFPEQGSAFFSRALQFGESRVIVGAHFPTDTIASRVGNYFTLAQLLADDDISAELVGVAKAVREKIFDGCHKNSNDCRLSPSSIPMYDSNNIGFYGKKEFADSSLIHPESLPDKAGYLLRLRFPYLEDASRRGILASTAYPGNSLAGWDIQSDKPDSLWGVINLPTAYAGPTYLYETLLVNQTPGIYDIAGFSLADEWKNDISGPGRLIKQGDGVLTLSGNDSFGGLEVNQGTLIISGDIKYKGNSVVNGGLLVIKGNLNSDLEINRGRVDLANGTVNATLDVNQGGLLSGNGILSIVTIHNGGSISPGYPGGTLNIEKQITFESGSQYQVIVAENGQHTQIKSPGTATLNGGKVYVSLENNSNMLTQSEVRSLLGQQYNILTAQLGVRGQFDVVLPNYLFLGTGLSYQPNGVTLSVGRNDTSFASVAQTQNERTLAAAADLLPAGNPVYESILNINTADEARQTYRQMSGQIHADIASALMNDSRYLREVLNGRLRQAEGLVSSPAIKTDEGGAWVQLLGAWEHASGDANATGYQGSTYGVLVGLDAATADWRLGWATGYTRTSLHGGYGTKADSNNYHLAVYGDKLFGALALRGSAGHTWHRIDTKRSVNYGMQSDRDTAKYSARTDQLFTEAGYSMQGEWLNLEPFVNLAYVNFENNGIAESGGAAALRGDKQHTDATVSTLGLRADGEWQMNKGATVVLRSELGWQHHYGDLERDTGLRFNGGNAPFVVNSVPVSRDGIVLKAGAEVMVSENATLSLGYGGQLSQNHQDNSVSANFSWRF